MEYAMSERDEIRNTYLKCVPYQIQLQNYHSSKEEHILIFQYQVIYILLLY